MVSSTSLINSGCPHAAFSLNTMNAKNQTARLSTPLKMSKIVTCAPVMIALPISAANSPPTLYRFKLGFCIHGNLCRSRHAPLNTRSPPIAEAALIGRPGHLHGAPSYSHRAQLVTANQQRDISAGPAIGSTRPPLPPGPPPASVRRTQKMMSLPNTNATAPDPFS